MDTVVELEGVNGEWFTLAGPQEGDRGVHLGTGVEGLYDPPVKVVYEEPGNYPGARYLNHRILRRDIVFGVEILNDKGSGSWLSRDSEWRKAWAFDRDCKLHITTEESGHRYLKLRLLESPDVSLFTDPKKNVVNRVKMVCVAGDPFWYQEDEIYDATCVEDTTFNPNPLPWPWPKESLPTETLYITVDPSDGRGGLNPTDQPVFLKWGVPGSALKPSEPYIPGLPWLGAPKSPATIWTVPDYSFEDPEKGNRRIRMPGLIGGLRTEQVQAVFIQGKPTGGNFKLAFEDEWTWDIPWNASNGVVKAALEGLAGLAFNDVAVTRAQATNERQVIRINGGPTGGTYTLTVNGETTLPIAYNASAGTVRTRLAALASIGNNDVSVDSDITTEQQTVQLIGEPTAGTFTLSILGHTTAPIPWNATAWGIQTALLKLPIFQGGWLWKPADIAVSKASGSYQPWKITFQEDYKGIDLPLLVVDTSQLSGGAGIDAHVETIREGSRIHEVTFQGGLSGFDLPLMTADSSLLTGGTDMSIEVIPAVDGSRPYMITFTGTKSGEDPPLLAADVTGLTGGTGIGSRVAKAREGRIAPEENCIIDTDPRVEQVSSESGSQIWSRMNGVRFRHYVPPYTKSKTFEITVSGCVPGQMITLRIPRPWTRPWGLE